MGHWNGLRRGRIFDAGWQHGNEVVGGMPGDAGGCRGMAFGWRVLRHCMKSCGVGEIFPRFAGRLTMWA